MRRRGSYNLFQGNRQPVKSEKGSPVHDAELPARPKAEDVHPLEKGTWPTVETVSKRIELFFASLRGDERFHLGLGDVRLTLAEQEALVALVRATEAPGRREVVPNAK